MRRIILSAPFRRAFEERREHGREPALYVLDFLELGNPSDRHPEHRSSPLVQGIGVKYFTLLEGIPLPAVRIDVLERVELGPHSKVKRLIPISYEDLTSVARGNLPEAVTRIVLENEKAFVEFFNVAEPVNIRLHALELLPGIGKKTMKAILEERGAKKFESFNDIRERAKLDPVKVIVERIMEELRGEEKYHLFVKPPVRGPARVYLGYLEKIYEGGL